MFELALALPGPLQWAVSFLLALFPLVMAHELGHFVLAKINRVRVDEFGIGFPPRAWRIARVGETDYTLNWLPIGGFVRLAGEDDPSIEGSFASRSKKARSAVLLAGPGANLVLAALLLVGIAALRPVPQPLVAVTGASLVDIEAGSPAEQAGLQTWDIVVAVDDQPLSRVPLASEPETPEQAPLVALQQLTRAAVGNPMRLTVLRGASLVQVASLPQALTTAKTELPGVNGRTVVNAPSGSLVVAGDLILDPGTGLASELLEGSPMAHKPLVLRNVSVVQVSVTPKPDAKGVGRMGVALNTPMLPVRLSAGAAVVHGLRLTGQMSVALIDALVGMVRRTRDVDLRGPLGIAEISRQATRQGPEVFLGFMALLSINFAVINLLPIPALDGGRLLFIAAEAIRGRRVEPSREALVHLIGFGLVLGLMAVLTLSDLASMSERFRLLLGQVTGALGIGP